jgi:hypothetical protein
VTDYIALESTTYLHFASNNTSGSGDDGASAVFDVRLCGAASSAAPVLSGSATLLTHANYPAGCYEIAVAATTGNGFAASNTYAVFCTLAVDSQNPSGFVGAFRTAPVRADVEQVAGDPGQAQALGNLAQGYSDDGYLNANVTFWNDAAVATPTVAGVPEVDLTHIMGTATTQGAAGRLAGGFTTWFNVASPTGTVNSLPAAIPNANGGLPILSSAGTTLGYTVTTVTTLNTLGANAITAGTLDPTASAEIADAVWDEAIAGHLSAGSTGLALSNAGSSGDPLSAAVPGAYAAGTAGFILGTALPGIAPGSANGLLRAGTNAATTFATLTVTGNWAVGGSFTVNSFATALAMTVGGDFVVSGNFHLQTVQVDSTTDLVGATNIENASNNIEVNTVQVNSTPLTGTGVIGDEWGPA